MMMMLFSSREIPRRLATVALLCLAPAIALLTGILLTGLLLTCAALQAQTPGNKEAFVTGATGQWLEVADTPLLAIPVFTVEVWVRVESSGLLVTRDAASGTPSDWQLWYEDRRVAFITASTPPDSYFFTPAGSIVPGRWHHLALAVDGPSGSAELYIDGVSVIQPTFTPRFFDASTGLAFGGYYDNGNGSYLRGAIDEARMWNRIRSGEEIRRDMQHRLPLAARDGLVGYWSFCGNFADSSGYGHDLTAHGVTAPLIVTGLPMELACDAPPGYLPSFDWTVPTFPANPCLRDTAALADVIVYNHTGAPLSIDRTAFASNDGGDFLIVSDPTPVTLPPGDSIRIGVGFRASDHGVRRAMLSLLGDSTLLIDLEAWYDGPLVTFSGLPLRLISTDGAAVTASCSVRNASTQRDAVVSDVTVIPPDGMTVLTPLPLIVPPGSESDILLRYDPGEAGEVDATLAFVIDACAFTSSVTAEACPSTQFAALHVPAVSGSPGDTLRLPLTIAQWTQYTRVEHAVLHGWLDIDCDALYPLFGDGGVMEDGVRRVALDLPLQSGGDTVATLPFLVLLGTGSDCGLQWTVDEVTSDCPLMLAGGASPVTVEGLCQEGGTRFFDGSRQLVLEQPHPSPGNGSITLRFSTVEAGPTSLAVYDLSGRMLHSLVHESLPPGSYQHSFDTGVLASGVYLLRLRTPGQLRTRRLVVVK